MSITNEGSVLAIDPGSTQSAVIWWCPNLKTDKHRSITADICSNDEVLERLYAGGGDITIIEMVQSFGMPVGREIFETVVWIGRFYEAVSYTKKKCVLVYRSAVKLHHCNSVRAKDSNIRQALIDKYGPPGKKKVPGLTYGLKEDLWQAFALATYWTETHAETKR